MYDMKKALIIGNWKLNPNTQKQASTLAAEVVKLNKKTDALVVVAPPSVYLSEVAKTISRSVVSLAAQDVSTEPLGAFTGEVSAIQLKDIGVKYVIVGHSERRAMGETDKQIAQKVQQLLKNKLIPVVCVGEKERDSHGDFFSVVEKQIKALAGVMTASDMKKIVIAYEPIWAIGTGKTATVDDVKEMQLFIYSVLTKAYDRTLANAVLLLYGGSVKPQNAKELHTHGGMQGFLVGGASLRAKDFSEIVKVVTT
jgi:triosephosphate isomerase (TIM)